MPQGKYFMIRSKLNPDLVLGVPDGGEAGTRVKTFPENGDDNQIWYLDHVTGTIRCKANNLCLDCKDNRMCVNPHDGGADQKWHCDGDHVCCADHSRVLDIVAGNANKGAEVCTWEVHGGMNQCWTFDHKEPTYFYIESKLNGKVLDITGGDASAGTKVIMWHRKDDVCDNQLWYEDKNGVIRSKLNNFILDGTGGSPLVMNEFDESNKDHWWLIREDKIVNRHDLDMVFDIRASNKADGAEVLPYKVHGGNNQLWNFVPA